jgi:hypothetical protein
MRAYLLSKRNKDAVQTDVDFRHCYGGHEFFSKRIIGAPERCPVEGCKRLLFPGSSMRWCAVYPLAAKAIETEVKARRAQYSIMRGYGLLAHTSNEYVERIS